MHLGSLSFSLTSKLLEPPHCFCVWIQKHYMISKWIFLENCHCFLHEAIGAESSVHSHSPPASLRQHSKLALPGDFSSELIDRTGSFHKLLPKAKDCWAWDEDHQMTSGSLLGWPELWGWCSYTSVPSYSASQNHCPGQLFLRDLCLMSHWRSRSVYPWLCHCIDILI